MAIATLAAALSGLQNPGFFSKVLTLGNTSNKRASFWGIGTNPGGYDTTLNGVVLSNPVAGQIVRNNPPSGNAYLGRVSRLTADTVTGGNIGALMICDRLWHNGGFTITSVAAQTIVSPAWSARDAAGSSNGDGVLLALEISATVGAGVPSITVGYTNELGVAGRTGTNIDATVTLASAGGFYPISLQAGDNGVRSVQSMTLSASWTSGTVNLVAYRPYLFHDGVVDAFSSGMPQIFNGTVPFLLGLVYAWSGLTIIGTYAETNG